MNALLLWTAAVSVMVDRGGCYPGQMLDRLPRNYLDQLDLLELALAMNDEWSAVWSEKLYVDTTNMPDAERCVPLVESPGVAVQAVDPFNVVMLIVDKCWHSGQYVNFGVKILSHSLRCYFLRNARVHVSVVLSRLSNVTPEFVDLLRLLVNDYKTIADRLAAVDSSLVDVVQLATFFYDVADASGQLAEQTPEAQDRRDDLEKRAANAFEVLDTTFSSFCMTDNDDWFDAGKNEVVSLKPVKYKKKKDKKNKDKKKEDDEEKKDKKKDKDKGKKGKKKENEKEEEIDEKEGEEKKNDEKEGEEKDKKDKDKVSITRVNELRLIMRKVFDGLFISKMPDEFWGNIFTETIFKKASDFQERDPEEKPKLTVKRRKKGGGLSFTI